MTSPLEPALREVAIRPATQADRALIAAFAETIPPHDLLFLSRDIRNPRVLTAWLGSIAQGEIESLVAIAGERIVATTAVIRDPLSWSAHVAEVRLLVLPEWRGRGLGRTLLETSVKAAIEAGAAKLTARMTPDQRGAVTLFEEAGFRGEAMLRDQVRDDQGQAHDLAVLALDIARASAQQQALRG